MRQCLRLIAKCSFCIIPLVSALAFTSEGRFIISCTLSWIWWDSGIVPFVAYYGFENNEVRVALFLRQDRTGVRFVRYNSNKHDNYIALTDVKSGEARSNVGKMKEQVWQRVNLLLQGMVHLAPGEHHIFIDVVLLWR